ncbi:hypothetical protein GOODEAATRI_026148 [Goodea atripinnis]|uniref:Syntaxin 6/10/61 N-terminal domain-containing protein n=1 Tax=Goodea atripinnis TaxID=208336 RepID=A0ABV0N7N7_9TELE
MEDPFFVVKGSESSQPTASLRPTNWISQEDVGWSDVVLFQFLSAFVHSDSPSGVISSNSQFPVCVFREVEKAVHAAQSLHHRWSELLQEEGGASKEEVDWTTNELRNSLRSIEWDLEDLDETISILHLMSNNHGVFPPCHILTFFLTVPEGIVESNPKKFNLEAAELTKRKAFIISTRRTVKVGITRGQVESSKVTQGPQTVS